MSKNAQIAGLLRQIAALLEAEGVAFKPAAYRRAAQVIENLSVDIAEISEKKRLMEYPGIGEAIASKILEFLETGHVKTLDDLLRKTPRLPFDLTRVEDLGVKRARQIEGALGVRTVPDLIRAAEEGRLHALPRFSELLERKILENAKRVTERTRRFPRREVRNEVEKLLAGIRAIPGVSCAEVAGSFRREKETVGDIDVLVSTVSPQTVSDAISVLPFVRNVVAHGEKKLSFDLQSGIRTDIRFIARDQWGSALLYFTGSKDHNIALRRRAIRRGWKLSEYGLFKGKKVIARREEKDIYAALGLPWISPKERGDVLPQWISEGMRSTS